MYKWWTWHIGYWTLVVMDSPKVNIHFWTSTSGLLSLDNLQYNIMLGFTFDTTKWTTYLDSNHDQIDASYKTTLAQKAYTTYTSSVQAKRPCKKGDICPRTYTNHTWCIKQLILSQTTNWLKKRQKGNTCVKTCTKYLSWFINHLLQSQIDKIEVVMVHNLDYNQIHDWLKTCIA